MSNTIDDGRWEAEGFIEMPNALVYSLKARLQFGVVGASIPPLSAFPSSPKAKGNNFTVTGVLKEICGQTKSNRSGARKCF